MLRKLAEELRKRKKVARPEDVFIIGPDGQRKRKPVGDPRLRASDVFIMGPDGKRKRKPVVPKIVKKKRGGSIKKKSVKKKK